MTKTTFGKLVEGERFHLSKSTGLLADVGKPDTDRTFVKVSARKYARDGLTVTHTVGSTRATVWSTGKHA